MPSKFFKLPSKVPANKKHEALVPALVPNPMPNPVMPKSHSSLHLKKDKGKAPKVVTFHKRHRGVEANSVGTSLSTFSIVPELWAPFLN